jgi:hypothetical protein
LERYEVDRATYVDTGDGDGGVNNDTLSATDLNAHLLLGNLLGDEGRNVGLERSRSEAHDDQTENENTEGGVRILDDSGSSRSDEDKMADLSDEY